MLPPKSLLPLLAAAGCLLLPAFLTAAPTSGEIGDGTMLFLPDGLAPDNLPKSLALVAPPEIRGDLPAGWTLKPEFSKTADGKTRVTLAVPSGTSLYGEGEVTGPLLRNNTEIILWNTDTPGYGRDKGRRLYQSHPWVMGVRADGTAFGFLCDTTFRAGIKTTDTLIDFVSDGPAFPVIVVDRPTPQDVVRALGKLTGTLPLPPRWSLGYHQCRWSYEPDSRVRQIADEFRRRKIPCDVIWMDIDYMDGFKIFTFDSKKFPNPRATNDYLHTHDFHSVWMIDPGVKAEKGYSVYDSGTAADVWIKTADGDQPYVGKVWPGDCVFPDFTQPKTCRWWAALYKDFMARGVDGVWNDMNEPAVFGGPDSTMDIGARHRGGDGLPPDTEARYHNVFGMLEVHATREGVQAAKPDKRPFVLSRAGYLGSQRYAATWTGDNLSTWEHLKVSIPMSISLGLSGQPFSGPDCGGFGEKATPELWAHWIAVDAFFPFCRGHAAKDAGAKEPWAFGEETEAAARTALERRYRLLPYLYTLFRESEREGMPVMRPVFFADPKDVSLRSEEQAFLLGGDLLVVPKWATQPHLPKGAWLPVPLVSGEEEGANKKYQPEVRLRPGAIVPVGEVVQHTGQESLAPLTLMVCLDPAGNAEGKLYEDAGDGFGYQSGDFLLTTYRAQREGGEVVLRIAATDGLHHRQRRKLVVKLVTPDGMVTATGSEETPLKITLPKT